MLKRGVTPEVAANVVPGRTEMSAGPRIAYDVVRAAFAATLLPDPFATAAVQGR
ncbi:MAG: hypothetical protein ACREL7_01065 [Longimicrobiales bacterium]